MTGHIQARSTQPTSRAVRSASSGPLGHVSLTWRVFAGNSVVLGIGVLVLALSPATVKVPTGLDRSGAGGRHIREGGAEGLDPSLRERRLLGVEELVDELEPPTVEDLVHEPPHRHLVCSEALTVEPSRWDR
jgi:hypothetical protein